MTSEDNTTQGWRIAYGGTWTTKGDHYLVTPTGKRFLIGNTQEAHALLDEILAALQPQQMTEDNATQGWQVCPVCEGRGNVRQGFYNPWPEYTSTSTAPETCRRCGGAGTILAALQRPGREAALVEALRGWAQHFHNGNIREMAICGNEQCRKTAALISPPGLSEG